MIFPLINTSIYKGFSMAMLNNQMVHTVYLPCIDYHLSLRAALGESKCRDTASTSVQISGLTTWPCPRKKTTMEPPNNMNNKNRDRSIIHENWTLFASSLKGQSCIILFYDLFYQGFSAKFHSAESNASLHGTRRHAASAPQTDSLCAETDAVLLRWHQPRGWVGTGDPHLEVSIVMGVPQ